MSKHDDLAYVIGLLQADPERRESEAARQRRAKLAETLAASLSPPPAPTPEDVRDKLLATISVQTPLAGFAERVAVFIDRDVDATRSLLEQLADPRDPGWTATAMPGIRTFSIKPGPRRARCECMAIELAPGASFPRHQHQGVEWGFVLQGRVDEGQGISNQPGDIVCKDAGSTHSFRAAGPQPGILIVVLDGAVEFL